MTQDEIIRMAREAGIEANEDNGYLEWWNFAKLVAAHEREKWEQALPIAMDAMMLQEREACATVCEELNGIHAEHPAWGFTCANAIRARSTSRGEK